MSSDNYFGEPTDKCPVCGNKPLKELDEGEVTDYLYLQLKHLVHGRVFCIDLAKNIFNRFGTKDIVSRDNCEHNGYTIHNVCHDCGKFLNKEESDKCCNGS